MGNIVIWTILILLIHEHGRYIFPFICVFFNLLHQYLIVLWVEVFCLLRYVYSKVFYFFDETVNRIVSLISLSDLTLLVSRDSTYFYVLILYPATVPNSLMSSNSFLVASLGFSTCSYHVICKQWPFYFWIIIIWITILFLLWLLLLGLSKLCWVEVAREDIFVLYLILEEMLSAFHHWVWCLAVGLSHAVLCSVVSDSLWPHRL